MFETLERRDLMSAAPHPVVMTVGAKPQPAVVVAAKVTAKTASARNVVGGWTGSMRLDGSKTDSAFSITFAFQRGLAASGAFNLGPTMKNQVATSTMVFDQRNNARALIATSKLSAGFTGAISANGKMLYGRFSFNTATGWKTGTFTLTRAA